MNEKKKQFQIWLPPELKNRLAAAAKQDRRSMSSFALLAIEAACAKAEAEIQQGLTVDPHHRISDHLSR